MPVFSRVPSSRDLNDKNTRELRVWVDRRQIWFSSKDVRFLKLFEMKEQYTMNHY